MQTEWCFIQLKTKNVFTSFKQFFQANAKKVAVDILKKPNLRSCKSFEIYNEARRTLFN